jgi:hypothetical protein
MSYDVVESGVVGDVHWQVVSDPCPSDIPDPFEHTGWRVVSFGRRDAAYDDPDNYGFHRNDDGEVVTSDIGLRRKLDCGTAFVLSYFEHGACTWSLQGTGPQCRWDSVSVGGLLIYEEDVKDLPKGYEARAEGMANMLEAYSNWCNGWLYGWRCFVKQTCPTCADSTEDELEAVWGYFFCKDAEEEARSQAAYFQKHRDADEATSSEA